MRKISFACCVLESGIAVCNAAAIYVVSMILYNNLDYKLLHNNNLHIAWIVSLNAGNLAFRV